MEHATLSSNRRAALCPNRLCELQVGIMRGESMHLLRGYQLDTVRRVWVRNPHLQLQGVNQVPQAGAIVRCWSCRQLMAWPFGEPARGT